ncbi:MAG: protein-L-isoaspartate(D-aspartate) O-methyltransferase [Bacteroidales bacterium]|nr:protein-L-isoaspartate(D-aspartate) O-methyltransferase [Bacteroidales bacterium]MBR5777880.1 protein-L-isoaspartate(D-aspartate) O-methyltransferase [Bacteroidales bacterium]
MPVDTFRHKGLRKRLCAELREKGITNEAVLAAMEKIPRHFFLESSFDVIAYEDRALPILCDQTISQPYTVAFQTQLLNVKPGDKIMEIGTGSGYQTSVLCELKAQVFSIERHKGLFDKAKKHLAELGYTAKTFFGDGYKGLPAYGPFDKVIVTCGAPEVPTAIVEQMKVGGIMVIPLGSEVQEMKLLTKISQTELVAETFDTFRFVPMLEKRKF